jgi:hypothetical protein
VVLLGYLLVSEIMHEGAPKQKVRGGAGEAMISSTWRNCQTGDKCEKRIVHLHINQRAIFKMHKI